MRNLSTDECDQVAGGIEEIVVVGTYTGGCYDPYQIYLFMQYYNQTIYASQGNYYYYGSGGGSGGGSTTTTVDGVTVGTEGSSADVQVKSGASLSGLSTEMQSTMSEIDEAWDNNTSVTPVITSGTEGYDGDGVHGAGSLHYSGDALDLRANNISAAEAQAIVNELQTSLGSDYDVVYETYTNPANNHIHIEYDP